MKLEFIMAPTIFLNTILLNMIIVLPKIIMEASIPGGVSLATMILQGNIVRIKSIPSLS